MLEHLMGVSVRSFALAAVAGVILCRRRSAALQHAVWASVVCGMLGLFAFGGMLPRLSLPVLEARPMAGMLVTSAPTVVAEIPRFGSATARVNSPMPARSIDWREIAEYAYAAVAMVLLLRFAVGMFLAWRLVAGSRIVDGFRESDSIGVPLTIGWLRPVIVLPTNWREWQGVKLDAVLTHEGAHVRRRDGLIAMLAGINRCIFWFHPLAWWVERRLTLLAELACDEACVAELSDRNGYANVLIEMARTVDGSQGRVQGFSMAASSHLRQRIDSILETRAASKGLNRAARAMLVACAIPVVWGAGAIELAHRAAQMRMRSRLVVQSIEPAPPAPRPGDVSCGDSYNVYREVNPDRGGVGCMSLRRMLQDSLEIPGDRLVTPDWAAIERFDIEAALPNGETESEQGMFDQLRAMGLAVLKDRFGLKMHTGVRDGPVMALVVAEGEAKIRPAAPDSGQPDWVRTAAKGKYADRMFHGVEYRSARGPEDNSAYYQSPDMGPVKKIYQNGVARYEAPSITMQGLAELATISDAGTAMDVVIVDATGMRGRYQVVLDVSMGELMGKWWDAAFHGAHVDIGLDTARDALKALGLELRPGRAPLETVVVDHLEKTPKGN